MWVVIVLLMSMELMDVSCNTLSKAAMAKGMSNYIFTTYTHAIGLFLLLPFAFLFHSSPTLASAMNNLSPAFTFIVAIISRMEILNLRAHSSLLKLIGTLVSISGAFIVTFYQGLPITVFPPSPTEASLSLRNILQSDQPNWVLGGFFLATSSIFLSLSFVVKTWVARDFRSEVLITIISFFFETIVAALITLVAERDNPSVWVPTGGIVLIAITFGALEVAVVNTVQTWACGKEGPLFVAMFKPLQMILAVIMGVSFLHDVLHLGSVIGGTTIAIGFYTVMKGKAEEETRKEGAEENRLIYSSETSADHKVPLLKDKSMDV
ncbi:hypothetical protein Cgig2_007031 [Carnegiea gigantea]|uniref:WAT1-related protein n=1 Tax=Carnegiea gigantea TaxID=171969 RepID=A0A9Q1QF50_9CARY|nr:hypothetical protein Cgig2_007031 [Carnegiea gigantea]